VDIEQRNRASIRSLFNEALSPRCTIDSAYFWKVIGGCYLRSGFFDAATGLQSPVSLQFSMASTPLWAFWSDWQRSFIWSFLSERRSKSESRSFILVHLHSKTVANASLTL